MKSIITAVLVATVWSSDAGPKKVAPRYLLVTQTIGTVNVSSTPETYSILTLGGSAWTLRYHEVDSPKEAIKKLNGDQGQGYRAMGVGELVGLWKLDERNKIEIDHKVVTHSKKVRVVDDSWDEDVWALK